MNTLTSGSAPITRWRPNRATLLGIGTTLLSTTAMVAALAPKFPRLAGD